MWPADQRADGVARRRGPDSRRARRRCHGPFSFAPAEGHQARGEVDFFSVVLLPVFLGLCFLVDHPTPLFIPFTVFLAGLSLMLYSRIFGEDIPPAKSGLGRPASLGASFGGTALPPDSDIGTNSAAGRRVRTAELVRAPSVTEHTTKLLDSD